MSRKYKFHKPESAYFISFATVGWVDIFSRERYCGIILDSITYCRNQKGLEVFAYCIMPNHIHMVIRAKEGNPSDILRDLKGFTSKQILKAIKEHERESRKEWLLNLFSKAGANNSNVKKYQLWQQNNKPIEVFSSKVIQQKIDYIHKNPVKAGYVLNPIDWKYSSARNYAGDHTIIKIDLE